MTRTALTTNHEWNTRFVSTENGEMAKQILDEFESFWNSDSAADYNDFIEPYETQYAIIKHQQAISYYKNVISLDQHKLKPNSMQTNFITNLKKIIENGEDRALLISATGTGKTYASAFAAV
jgi:type I site-specific restriction endonuclease